MTPDLSISGILVPGLFAIACIALATTAMVLRLLAAMGASRWLGCRALAELAVFFILFGLLVQGLSIIGPLS